MILVFLGSVRATLAVFLSIPLPRSPHSSRVHGRWHHHAMILGDWRWHFRAID